MPRDLIYHDPLACDDLSTTSPAPVTPCPCLCARVGDCVWVRIPVDAAASVTPCPCLRARLGDRVWVRIPVDAARGGGGARCTKCIPFPILIFPKGKASRLPIS